MSVVYFVQPDGRPWIKVGFTNNLRHRLVEIQCGSPELLTVLLTVPGAQRLEAAVHRCVSHFDSRGEWKQDSAQLRSLMAALRADPDNALAVTEAFYDETRRKWRERFDANVKAADMLIATVLPLSSAGRAQ